MKQSVFILLSLVLLSCSDNISELANDKRQSSLNQENQTRATVDIHNLSTTNPKLLNDWENVQTIALNTSGNHNVTAPWTSGTASSLSDTFRKDIKKEDGWIMHFHTFKQKGLDEKQNYMCFYNQFTGYLKVFYYYEGDRASQGTQWYMKTADGSSSRLFNLADFLAYSDDVADINTIVVSNQVGDPTKGLQTGWNGFEFEVPYCTDYKDKEFTIGAYDRVITNYSFLGDVDLKSSGTITPVRSSSGGWQTTIANLAGQGAKSLVDSKLDKAKKKNNSKEDKDSTGTFGQKLADAISSIPASSYSKLLSAGLGLIFGKATVVNDYKLNVTTTGKIQFSGTGTTEITSGIPSVTFSLYSLMNNATKEVSNTQSFVYNPVNSENHYVGVWNLRIAPKVFYQRITSVTPPYNSRKNADGTYSVDNIKMEAPSYWTRYELIFNPDLKSYANYNSTFTKVMRCDSLLGNRYKPKMIDIGDYLNSSLMYRDKEKRFYDMDGYIETGYTVTEQQKREKTHFYFDWGNIDCGRQVGLIEYGCTFNYRGKCLKITQTRLYPTGYGIDMGALEDVVEGYYDKGSDMRVNGKEPFYEYQKKKNGIPIINYEP